MPEIRVVDLKKYFGKVKAVDGISFQVRDGEFVALLGPSGCGKTTTLLMLAGIYKPTSGEIWFDDQLMNNVPPRYRGVGMVFQNYALYPHMTVYENIAFPLKAKGMNHDEIDSMVKEITKKLLIDHLLDRKPTQISGGQQQRVALARALVKEPKVLLFDEPLSNLDAKLRMMMRAEIKKLQEDLGITSVYVTHDQAEAMTMASRIAIFNKGKIIQYGTPDEVYNSPNSIFVATFMGNPPMNLIYGMEFKREEGEGVLKLKNISVKLSDYQSKKVEEYGKTENLVLGFRPEDVNITKKEEGNGIWGEVYVLEPLGRDLIVNVKIEGVENLIKVFSDPTKEIREGDRIFLRLNPEALHVFDGETEITIF